MRIPEPICLTGSGWTKTDAHGALEARDRLKAMKPQILWLSIPPLEAWDDHDSVAATFCLDAAAAQNFDGRLWVIAHPHRSTLWDSPRVQKCMSCSGVHYQQVNLSSFSDVVTSKTGNLGLLTNAPSGWIESLHAGTFTVDKTKPETESDYWFSMSDSYPYSFCQSVLTLVDGFKEDKSLPVTEKHQASLIDDLLVDLDLKELTALCTVFTVKEYEGSCHIVNSVAEVSRLLPYHVTDNEVKWFMNWVNARPLGTKINFDESARSRLVRQASALRALRKRHFPQCAFAECVVLRGILPNLVSDIASGEGQAVVMMWRKNSTSKRLYAAGLQYLDMKGFNPSSWSIVIMYNAGGGATGRNNVIPQPPSIPVESQVGPDDPAAPAPREPPLPPPSWPPPYVGPTYSDPADLIPPWHDTPVPEAPPASYIPAMPAPQHKAGWPAPLPQGAPLRGVSPPPPPAGRMRPEASRSRSRSHSEKESETETYEDDDRSDHDAADQRSRDRSRSRDDPQSEDDWRRRARSRSRDSSQGETGSGSDGSDGSDRRRRERSRSHDGSLRDRSRSRDGSVLPPSGTSSRRSSRQYTPESPRSRTRSGSSTPSLRLPTPGEAVDDERVDPLTRGPRRGPERYDLSTPRPPPRERSRSHDDPQPAPTGPPKAHGPPTAVKTMTVPRAPPAGRQPPEPKEEDDIDSEDLACGESLYCGACAVLSLRSEHDRCYNCLNKEQLPECVRRLHENTYKTEHWASAQQADDLVILEDDGYWSHHSDGHKLAAVTCSFSFVTGPDDEIIDISDLASTPATSEALYLNDSWLSFATDEEFEKEVMARPAMQRPSLRSAYRVVKTPQQRSAAPKRKPAARREASQEEKRLYAKQFAEAKQAEYKSWAEENDVYDLIDMRKEQVKNFVTGRWVLTIKRDKDGKFIKCKARWVLRGFQDRQNWDLQTDSPTSTRPGFRLQCQAAANNDWDLTHIDLKTAFLQGNAFDEKRNVVCQLPPEAGHPPYMAARLKRAAYGLNDAPRLWWNRLDTKLRSYGLVPTRADRCCYVLYSNRSSLRRKDVKGSEAKKAVHWTEEVVEPLDPAIWEASSFKNDSRAERLDVGRSSSKLDIDGALELLLDPITGSAAKGKSVEGVVTIHVDDALMAGTPYFVKHVVDGLRKDFKVGSEDKNDVLFVGQRIRWVDKDKPSTKHIRVDQERKVEELSEIKIDSSLRETLTCTPDLHTQFRSVLGQVNWLQSRTQYQSCYLFSRSASASASPTVGDVKALNKLVRKIRQEVVVLNFWPLRGTNRIVGYPDASFRNNADKTSQRGQAIFLAEPRAQGKIDTRGSLVDYESQKIKRQTLSTTVAELYAFMKCFGTCQFLRGLWMDISGTVAEVHMRTDANNLVTTASTTHLPEQRETIHMINQLRTEACSGAIDDLAHVVSADCLADCLTKHSAKPDALIKAVSHGILPNVDKHPPFRELMRDRHKAYLAEWIVYNLPAAEDIVTFLAMPIHTEIVLALQGADWYDQPE